MNFQNLVVFLALVLSPGLEAFKILVFYPSPLYSHQRAILPLTERLVKDGHELFVISPNVVPGLKHHENYTFVDVSFSYKYFVDDKNPDDDSVSLQRQISKWEILNEMFKAYVDIAKRQLLSDQYLQFKQRVESENIKFDLIIVETFFIPFACVMSWLLPGSAPIISMSTLTADWAEENLGSITHLSFQPGFMSSYTNKLSLWQKIENWVSHHYLMSNFRKITGESVQEYLKEAYGSLSANASVEDGFCSNVALSLIASNSLYSFPRTLGPNVIEVGPLHLKTPEKLPKNLLDWLDGAEKGVIYFSLGSNMKSKSLPEEVRANFLKFFKQLPSGYRVLWKWELDGRIPGQSDNILPQKWLPQDGVLAHPRVKVFITQGGLQSFQEVVHYGVPTIGIPWFGDQECNVAKMVDAGIGVQLLPQELNSYEKMKAAIEAVLYDERYAKNMKRHSAISRDFTSRGMDQAVFWVEHVAKHGGASHLRPATADTTLFQYFCFDIISIIIAICSLSLFLVYSLAKLVFSITLQKPRSKTKTS